LQRRDTTPVPGAATPVARQIGPPRNNRKPDYIQKLKTYSINHKKALFLKHIYFTQFIKAIPFPVVAYALPYKPGHKSPRRKGK
jgi:hypothetical protein